MPNPRKVELQPDGGLLVQWTDGHLSPYPPHALRRACRCAHCEDEWTGAARLDPGAIPASIRVVEVKPVGRYGLSLNFSDGHGTGIYTFTHLRDICFCEACAAGSAS